MEQGKKDKHSYLRKPEWLRTKLLTDGRYAATSEAISSMGLHTICQSGLCPNRSECWRSGTATFMIGGDVCTRCCRFCNTKTGRPMPLDDEEPLRVAASIEKMQLKYTVITSVDRDDLPDFGATHWAKTIRLIREKCPQTGIEALIPDFQGRTELIDIVLKENPDVVSHNMETTLRLTPSVRSVARYEQSLRVLRYIAQQGFICKTGFMVGLGESHDEVNELMDDIKATGCSVLTIGQYLQPSVRHLPVVEYITPKQFAVYREMALEKGFQHVESGPLVRSSYHAERILSARNL